jgi:hypothetical protein
MKLTEALVTAQGVMKAGRIAANNPEKALAIQINDCMREYGSNFDEFGYAIAQRRLTKEDRLFCGIGYYEFFIEDGDSSDIGYCRAAEKQNLIRGILGVDGDRLWKEMEALNGRSQVEY